MPTVKKGDKGPEVRLLQDRLIELGFMTVLQQSTGPGTFGNQTEAALKAFQKSQGLATSGQLTDETAAALATPKPIAAPPVSSTAVDTRLSSPGTGYVSYKAGVNGANQFGRASTIVAIQGLGAAWFALHPDVPMQIGHISLKGGAVFKPHKGHRKGIDVDVRPFRSDKALAPATWNSAKYSQELTLRFARLVTGTFPGVVIFFNDPDLIKLKLTKKLKGHDDHLHIRFAG